MPSRGRTRALVAGLVTVCVAGVVAALVLWWLATASPRTPDAGHGATSATGPTSASPPPAGAFFCDGVAAAAPANPHLAEAIDGLARTRQAAIHLAWWTPAGIRSAGDAFDAPAWSTIKVPLAAAVIQSGQGEQLRADIAAALRSSDNAAADRLWRSQGATDAERAGRVTAVLRQAGDRDTTVPAERQVAEFSVFGQTRWSAEAQVAFLGALPCLGGGKDVLDQMAHVDPGQRWGFATRPDAVDKPGWGPTPQGRYVVRQFGWYPAAGGARVPVAVVVEAATFDAATAVVGAVGDALG